MRKGQAVPLRRLFNLRGAGLSFLFPVGTIAYHGAIALSGGRSDVLFGELCMDGNGLGERLRGHEQAFLNIM
ncbi:hypothetical protein GCM10023219_27130 [Stakelama sediminis]